MGIKIAKRNAKAPQALALQSKICSYLFEQEYDELKNHPDVKSALIAAKNALTKLNQ